MTTRLSRLGTLVVCGAMLGACSQLIGLNDYDEGAAGEGAGGSGAKGGATQGGKGGTDKGGAGVGGSGLVSGAGGTRGGSAGSSSGRGGAAGSGGSIAKGGDSGQGGEGNTGGEPPVILPAAGAGGESPTYDCVSTTTLTKVVLLDRDASDDPSNNTFAVVSPQIGSPADDQLWIDFYSSARYDGEATGTFDLSMAPDDNYATCARCVWLGQDLGTVSDPKAYFYVKSGTMVIADDSYQIYGYPKLTLDKVTLIESTIDVTDTHVSETVKNPRCLYLEHAELDLPPPASWHPPPKPPASWTCDVAYYGSDDGCDCGCGALDPDCLSKLGGACDPNACGETGSCSNDAYCYGIDPTDNSKCDATPDWVCSPLLWGDPDKQCDCACGVVDVDCASADPLECDSCTDYYSCDPVGDCKALDPTDNSKCVAPP